MPHKNTVTKFSSNPNGTFLKCPECKYKNHVKPLQKTTTKHLVCQSCWHCRQTLFKVTFITALKSPNK